VDRDLYMRVRGRVLGPYDQKKLQALARRGQLGRMHEVSEDGVNWVRASTYPELFVSQDGQPPGVEPQQTTARPEATSGAQSSPSANGPQPDQQWFYEKNGTEQGPVELALLQHMASLGQVGPDTQVWTEGMPQWVVARKVPSLAKSLAVEPSGRPAADEDAERAAGVKKLPQSLCRAAVSVQPWAYFVAVTTSVYAGLSVVAGILLLIVGARDDGSPPVVAFGLFLLIGAAVAGVGAYLMFTYQGRLRALRYTSTAIVLEKALDVLRALWVYSSICLIVIVALIVTCIVILLSLGVQPPIPV